MRRALSCYNALLDKMKRQKQAVEVENESQWLKIIHENDGLIGTIQQLDEEIQRNFDALTETERGQVTRQTEAINSQIQTCLLEIIELDKACRSFLERGKNKISEEMKTLKVGKTLLKGYGPGYSKNSIFSKNV